MVDFAFFLTNRWKACLLFFSQKPALNPPHHKTIKQECSCWQLFSFWCGQLGINIKSIIWTCVFLEIEGVMKGREGSLSTCWERALRLNFFWEAAMGAGGGKLWHSWAHRGMQPSKGKGAFPFQRLAVSWPGRKLNGETGVSVAVV